MDGTSELGFIKRTTLRERSFYPKQKNRNSASLSVRKRKYDQNKQKNNEKTMNMIQQRSRSYFLSFTDADVGKETWLSPAVSIMCGVSPEPISLYDDGRPDYLIDDIKQTLFTDYEIDVLADLEEKFAHLPRERVLAYYQSVEPIVELYRQCLRDCAAQRERESQEQEELVDQEVVTHDECPEKEEDTARASSPEPEEPMYEFESPPLSPAAVVPTVSRCVGVLGAPIYKPAMKIRINTAMFSPVRGLGSFVPRFSAHGGVLIYAGPGCGKTSMLERIPAGVGSCVYDTDTLDCIVDSACVIVTNRHELLPINNHWLRIAFVPPRLIWNARCISKCDDWQQDWYPPSGASAADLRFSGTGFIGDYIEFFYGTNSRGIYAPNVAAR